jgi:hypothetical protein
MKTNKIIFLLITAFILAFTSCGDKDKDSGNTYLGQKLNSGAPSSAKMAQYGVSETALSGMFNNARAIDTSDANYKGYFEESESGSSVLYFIWSNKTEAKYNAVYNSLKTDLNLTDYSYFIDTVEDGFPAGTLSVAVGANDDISKVAVIMLFKKAYSDVPAGTMAVCFYKFS